MGKVVFSYLGLSIIFIVMQVVLEIFINEDLKKLLTQVTILLSMFVLLKPYLKAFRDSSDHDELKLVKSFRNASSKLYTCLGDEFDTDLFIYETVGDIDSSTGDLANIKLFKIKLTEKIGNNLNDYYLLREAIEIKLKSGFLYFLSDITNKILVSAITVILSGLFITKAINIINNDESEWGLLTLLIQCANFGLITLIIVYMFFYSFKGMKNRASLLKNVIDLIIKEKEQEKEEGATPSIIV